MDSGNKILPVELLDVHGTHHVEQGAVRGQKFLERRQLLTRLQCRLQALGDIGTHVCKMLSQRR